MFLPRVLVLYGTGTGQTRKIAQALADSMRSAELAVDVVNTADKVDPDPGRYAGVIVAAPVRAGRYPKPVRQWVKAHAEGLGHRPTAFVSVCLGVLERNPRTDAVLADIIKRFFAETGWRPETTKIVAGALLYRQYNWITRWFMRRIVARAHGDVDTSRDYEYTDWKDLESFGRDFSHRLVGSVPVKAAS
jgi:menaquinone-dependent protoporphyrinogen oxidase